MLYLIHWCDGSLQQSLRYICSTWIMFSLSCRKQAEAQFLQESLHSQGQKCRRRSGYLKMGNLGFASCFWVLLTSTDCCPQMDHAKWRVLRGGLLLNQPHQQLGTESCIPISSRSGAAQSTTSTIRHRKLHYHLFMVRWACCSTPPCFKVPNCDHLTIVELYTIVHMKSYQ